MSTFRIPPASAWNWKNLSSRRLSHKRGSPGPADEENTPPQLRLSPTPLPRCDQGRTGRARAVKTASAKAQSPPPRTKCRVCESAQADLVLFQTRLQSPDYFSLQSRFQYRKDLFLIAEGVLLQNHLERSPGSGIVQCGFAVPVFVGDLRSLLKQRLHSGANGLIAEIVADKE